MDPSIFLSEKACAKSFEEDMESVRYKICERRKEKNLVSTTQGKDNCHHKSRCLEYLALNDMDPGEVPTELELTFAEEQLIALIHPMICSFQVRKHQYAYKGNVICFPQDVQEIVTQLELPHNVKDLNSLITVRYADYKDQTKYHDFKVRRDKVKKALLWLKKHNPRYKHITISDTNLNKLPEDGNVENELMTITLSTNQSCSDKVTENSGISQEDVNFVEQSGVAQMSFPHQDKQIENKLNWPSMGTVPVDEFNTPGYISCAYPTLFPYGVGDFSDERMKKIKPHLTIFMLG